MTTKNHTAMKTRKTIGFVLAIAGLFIAVCTKDGSSHELACRFFGIALFATGAFIGRFFDGMEDKPEPATEGDDDNGFSKTDDHNPYPQE